MDISVTAKKKSVFAKEWLFSRLVPKNMLGNTLIWPFFPTILLVFIFGVSFLQPSVLTNYLPLFMVGSTLCCLCFRTSGLIAGYIAITLFWLLFFREFEPDQRLWQFGILFSLAVTNFITLLSVEEVEHSVLHMSQESKETLARLHQTELDFQQAEQAWSKQCTELETEIERLKQEAEQRRVEKYEDQRQFELIQSEIELLTSQKNALINEAREMRGLVSYESIASTEEIEQQLDVARATIEELNKQLEKATALETEFVQAQETILTLQTQLLEQPQEIEAAVDPEQITQLKQACAEAEELYCQLKKQQEAESKALLETRNELFQSNEKLQLLEKQVELKQTDLTQAQEMVLKLQTQLAEQSQTKETAVDLEQVTQLKRACAEAEGLYSQLRTQFEAKSKVLVEARKELFQSKEKLQLIEKRAQLEQMDPERVEVQALEKAINTLNEETERSEEEINHLEELISHILCQ